MPKNVVMLIMAACLAAISEAAPFSSMRFIAVGDTPYSEQESLRLNNEIAPAIKAARKALVIVTQAAPAPAAAG